MLKSTNAEFQSIQVWFTDQDNRPLEIEDSVNIMELLGRHYKNEIFSKTKVKKNRNRCCKNCF